MECEYLGTINKRIGMVLANHRIRSGICGQTPAGGRAVYCMRSPIVDMYDIYMYSIISGT